MVLLVVSENCTGFYPRFDYHAVSPAGRKSMSAAPWYLLAGGIVVVIAGYFIASLGSRGSGRAFFSPKMSDKEIERMMNESQGSPLGNLLMLLGFLIIFVSIIWRIVRIFVG